MVSIFRTIETHPLHYQMLNYIYEKQAITEIYFCETWIDFLKYLKTIDSSSTTTTTNPVFYKTPAEYRYLFYTEILPNIYLYLTDESSKRRYFQFIYSYEIADIMEIYYKKSCGRTDDQQSNDEELPGTHPVTTSTTAPPNANEFIYNRNTLREHIRNSIQSNFEQTESTDDATGANQNNNNYKHLSIVTEKIFNFSFEYETITSNSLTCPAVAIASYYMSTPEERLRYVFHTKDELCERIEAKRQEFLMHKTLFKLNEDGTTIEDYLLNTINVRLMDEPINYNNAMDSMATIGQDDELTVTIRNINDYQNQNKYDALRYSTNYQSLVKQHLIKLKIIGDSTIRNRNAILKQSHTNTELAFKRSNTKINKRKMNSKTFVTVPIKCFIDDDQSSAVIEPPPPSGQSPSPPSSPPQQRRLLRSRLNKNLSQLSIESTSSSESRIKPTQTPSESSIASNNSSISSSNREMAIQRRRRRQNHIGRNNNETIDSRITSTPTNRTRRLLMRNRQRFTKTFNISSVLSELPETDYE